MSLEKLPTEVLHHICQDVALFGSSDLVGLTRASRRFHTISNPILYATDLQESGGVVSMCFALASRQHDVVKLCLAAGIKPDLRVQSRHDLESIFLSKVQKHDNLNFWLWFSHHLDIGKDGRRFPEQTRHHPGLYDDILQDGNKPFRSVKAFYWTPLHVAVLRNDVELLALLLDHGADPNSAGRGVCPCYYQRLRRTFNRSVPPEALGRQDRVGMLERRLATRWSPLHVAVCKGNFECVQYLIGHFGLPHPTDSNDYVMEEARQLFQGEPVLVDLARSHPNALRRVIPRFDPLPPLHVAVEKYSRLGDVEKVYSMLKQAGCLEDVDVRDAFGDTPFAVAAFSGRVETFGTWLRDRGADVDFVLLASNGVRHSILNGLCRSGQYRDALSLMDLGVNVNRDAELHRGVSYVSALHYCCRWPVEEILQKQREALPLLKRLVHAGADVNARAPNGTTPLMQAACVNFPAFVHALLEGKPDIGAEDQDGHSALHHAVRQGLSIGPGPELSAVLATIQVLLDGGTDPNQQRAGRSAPPLFMATYGTGMPPGADPRTLSRSKRTSDGKLSPMAFIGPILVGRGANPNIYLDYPRQSEDSLDVQINNLQGHSLPVTAFYLGEFDSLDSLIACGTLVTHQDYMLMMRSLIDQRLRSRGSTLDAVQSLFRILNGPSLQLKRPDDRKTIMDAWTELLILSVGERPKLVPILAPHFSMTAKRGPGGKTALHLLAQWERKEGEIVVEFKRRVTEMIGHLMRCGASRQIDQPDDNGRSPLRIAVDRGNVTIAKALARSGASLDFEHKGRDGTTVDSPLRSAIKLFSETSWFEMADGMLDAHQSKWRRGKYDRYVGSVGLLKDLILHFRDNTFDEPGRMAARTNKLMVKLIELGADVNEHDEDGNTPLHLLTQLLYPAGKGPNASGSPHDIATSRAYKRARRSSMDVSALEGIDPDSVFYMPKESYMHMEGMNGLYPSDSDFENYGSDEEHSDDDDSVDEREPPSQDNSSGENGSSDDDDYTDNESEDANDGDDHSLDGNFFEPNSLRVMTRKGYNGDLPQHKPSGLARRGRDCQLDRADAWILSFFILLSESKGVSWAMKNKAGMTPLDYIHGLKTCRPKECTKAYRRIITALRNFDKEDPLSSQLLNKLTGSSVLPKKGRPFFFVYNRSGCYLVVPRHEGTRQVERRGRAGDKWSWVPLW